MPMNKSFWKKYRKIFIISAIIMIIAYIAIYACFVGNGFLTTGIDLTKSDWLGFLGGYLSFAGTVFVSMIAIFQTKYFADIEENRRKQERIRELQPIFSIDITALDSMIDGTAKAFNIHDTSTLPKHKNVTPTIENVSEYPIQHVIIFEAYLYQLLKPNEKKTFQIAYSDSPDIKKWKNHVIEILESEHERDNEGIPKWFNINYDDIDGHSMFQTFELKDFDGKKYYSLESTEEA